MTERSWIGGNNYKATLKDLRDERAKLLKLVEQLAQPGLDNGNLYRLKATILASLIKIDEYLDILEEIGQVAKQERKER